MITTIAMMKTMKSSGRKSDRSEWGARVDGRFGAGSASLFMAACTAATPAASPPKKSPLRKYGAITSRRMRPEMASVSEPCTPRPTSMRILRRSFGLFFAMSMMTPSSTPLRPAFHASATRMLYWSMVSGAVLGTIRMKI
ncbi:hypothetical protein LMG16407_02991 [Pandoraea apista]|nr:hypothetical protein LMG16407_02991 [Pandoraea apista]